MINLAPQQHLNIKLRYIIKIFLEFLYIAVYYKYKGKKSSEVLIMNDKTMTFSIGDQTEQEIRRILTVVYDSLKEKGYNPINQIVGYILSEDPTYITTHNNARNLIRRIDRDTLLQSLVRYYLTA